jgi:hypothetical protein
MPHLDAVAGTNARLLIAPKLGRGWRRETADVYLQFAV